MRRMRSDDGAAAILIAILLPLVLLGFGALVIDAGSLYSERRQLQNGADAATLALAQVCASGSCTNSSGQSPLTQASGYADRNSKDGASYVDVNLICGTAPGLTACATTPPGLPAGAKYVSVTTQTGTSAGASLMPAILGKVIDSSYNGKTVAATAIAAYGAPAGLTSGLPVTISLCEWNAYTANGTVFGTPKYTSKMEHILYLHDTTGAAGCKAGPAGSDLPGGFGWLLTKTSACTAYSDVNSEFPDDPGVSIDNACKDELDKLVNTTVNIPIFGSVSGTGANIKYTMTGFAAFYLTGWGLPGTFHDSTIPGTKCFQGGKLGLSSSSKYLCGVFTTPLEPADGVIGGGAGLPGGVTVFQLIG